MSWPDSCFCFIPQGLRVAANNVWSGQRARDVGDPTTWDSAVPLRPANPGNGPATHLGISTAVHADDVGDFEAESLPGQVNYWVSHGWTWEAALAEENLKVVPPLEP